MKPNILKLVVFVPEDSADAVKDAMGNAGAGVIGNYSHCLFSSKGESNFKPLAGSNPTVGEIGKMEKVIEERIETVCEREKLKLVIEAIRKVHPYEEVAFDIYPLISEEEL